MAQNFGSKMHFSANLGTDMICHKRSSGFDMAPLAAVILPGVVVLAALGKKATLNYMSHCATHGRSRCHKKGFSVSYASYFVLDLAALNEALAAEVQRLKLVAAEALVDALDMVRSQMNFKRLSLTDIKIDINRVPRKKSLIEAMEKADENSSWGKKLIVQKRRAALNDFDRFKLMLAKIKKGGLIRQELAKLKKENAA
ncbi:hypothetical protein CUMW_217540 [Citrus unshiu]|uniref:Large ribosomal subunit protein eL14 domain-containing protein n=1 Tax=Citrus unshiu TaxID=55188 RepID=A0A2H5QCP9_CITUN|nr:hypothetical protein CUMW_217540 [Citrus unshiu]